MEGGERAESSSNSLSTIQQICLQSGISFDYDYQITSLTTVKKKNHTTILIKKGFFWVDKNGNTSPDQPNIMSRVALFHRKKKWKLLNWCTQLSFTIPSTLQLFFCCTRLELVVITHRELKSRLSLIHTVPIHLLLWLFMQLTPVVSTQSDRLSRALQTIQRDGNADNSDETLNEFSLRREEREKCVICSISSFTITATACIYIDNQQ